MKELHASEGWIKCSTCNKEMFWVSTDDRSWNMLHGLRLWCWDCRIDKHDKK